MQVTFRFYEELNDFLNLKRQKKSFTAEFNSQTSVKDAIESFGVPHTEVDLILVNSNSVDFTYRLKPHDFVSVYPIFESIDISSTTNLRPTPLRVIKFVLDVHLGKLAKYLRLLGFDTLYSNSYSDTEIINISTIEKRIILTRDIGILKNNLVTHGYWLRSQDSKQQLIEVIHRFDLKNKINKFTRCIVCNGEIIKVDKIKIESKLEPKTRMFFNEFYQCKNCNKIYWYGSHYKNMLNFINSIK
ncbi:MAG: twitching motility protein PilT [Bacteroidetes bacterium GWF2_33_16]|nr:MAG: twitching motility protein PilT [Bacteroidetes bacterium GWE2_32_14]OFY06398.1 MAG: twitching motility protein PilT [Bacteroidetes bacterium GWF2_33_16]